MNTRTLVQATADVVTVINLRRGDVYKRLEDSYSGPVLQFGVVTDVMHNGTDAAITAIEFPQDWSGAPTPKLKTFGTDTELRLFAAQPEEVRQHFGEILEGSKKALDAAQDTWRRALSADEQVKAVVGRFTGPFAEELTAPQTGTLELSGPEEDDEDEDDDPAEGGDTDGAPF